mmetsp:Transcript_36760/g.37413  ORF Transcript_36760/g.37413 Transcript_36760/m.37413 type:complete len:186 (+) Transcript_36760:147-704(+)
MKLNIITIFYLVIQTLTKGDTQSLHNNQDQIMCELSSALNAVSMGYPSWRCVNNYPITGRICSSSLSHWIRVTCNSNGLISSISISSSCFSGSLPLSLGSLTSLTLLDISSNSLIGSLPSSLGQLHLLSRLEVDSNLFTGSLPSTLCQITSLSLLYTHNNPYLLGYDTCLSTVSSKSFSTLSPCS